MAGREVGDRVAGYSFTPPESWQAEEQPGRFELAGPSGTTAAMVMPHSASKREELQPLFDQGWIEPGVELQPKGEATVREGEAEQRLAGEIQGQPAQGMLIVRFSPHGGGVIVIGLGPAEASQSEIESAVQDIARSVRFTTPDTDEVVESWDSALRGRKLTYLHSYGSSGPPVEGQMTGGGMTEQHEILLRQDGSFEEYRESSLSIDVGGGGAGGGDRTTSEGTWRIQVAAGQALLELQKAGTPETHVLSQAEGEVYLDGRRYFVTES
jgi:hypothetical protein